jgi:hypothetical protein
VSVIYLLSSICYYFLVYAGGEDRDLISTSTEFKPTEGKSLLGRDSTAQKKEGNKQINKQPNNQINK